MYIQSRMQARKNPREVQRQLRERGTRFSALRDLKLLLHSQQACSRPELSALFNCVDYVARHDHAIPDCDAEEVMQAAVDYAGFTPSQRSKVAGWLRDGRPPHKEHAGDWDLDEGIMEEDY